MQSALGDASQSKKITDLLVAFVANIQGLHDVLKNVYRNLLLATLCFLMSGNSVTGGEKTQRSKTPHLDQTVELIRAQVGWFGPKPKKISREFLAAIATMNYVQSRVSPLNYSLLTIKGKPLPRTAEEYLASQAGICGGQIMTFRAILDRLKIRNRPVQFYLRGRIPAENHSHIGAEVFYAGKWHFFDVTWGTYFEGNTQSSVYGDAVMSIDEVLRHSDARQLSVTNSSDLWYQQWTSKGHDPFGYLTSKQMDLIVGSGGLVTMRPGENKRLKQVYIPTHQPNYIGRNNASADFGTLTFRLTNVEPEATQCTVTILGIAGSGQLVIEGKGGKVTRAFDSLSPGEHIFDFTEIVVDDDLHISVDSGNNRQIGYVVIKQISLLLAP